MAQGLSSARARVMQAIFRAQGPLSRHAISQMSGLPLSSVCGRVSELIDMGFLVVVGEVYDSATKREVEAVYYPDHIRSIKQLEKLAKQDRLAELEAIVEQLKKVVASTEGVVFKGQTVTWARAMRGMV